MSEFVPPVGSGISPIPAPIQRPIDNGLLGDPDGGSFTPPGTQSFPAGAAGVAGAIGAGAGILGFPSPFTGGGGNPASAPVAPPSSKPGNQVVPGPRAPSAPAGGTTGAAKPRAKPSTVVPYRPPVATPNSDASVGQPAAPQPPSSKPIGTNQDRPTAQPDIIANRPVTFPPAPPFQGGQDPNRVYFVTVSINALRIATSVGNQVTYELGTPQVFTGTFRGAILGFRWEGNTVYFGYNGGRATPPTWLLTAYNSYAPPIAIVLSAVPIDGMPDPGNPPADTNAPPIISVANPTGIPAGNPVPVPSGNPVNAPDPAKPIASPTAPTTATGNPTTAGNPAQAPTAPPATPSNPPLDAPNTPSAPDAPSPYPGGGNPSPSGNPTGNPVTVGSTTGSPGGSTSTNPVGSPNTIQNPPITDPMPEGSPSTRGEAQEECPCAVGMMPEEECPQVGSQVIQVPIVACELNAETGLYSPVRRMESISVLTWQGGSMAQATIKQFEQLADIEEKLCVNRETQQSIVSVPEQWDIRPEYHRPQAAIIWREKVNGKFLNSPYQTVIPYYNKDSSYRPNLSPRTSGNIQGILRLTDGSNIMVYASTMAEAKRVINSLRSLVDAKRLAGHTTKFAEIEANRKQRTLYPYAIQYHPQGVKSGVAWEVRYPT